MKHFLFTVFLFPFLSVATIARAADEEPAPRRWLHTHDHNEMPAAAADSKRVSQNGTAVYGWRYRADGRRAYRWSHCGDYHYWDGTHCADARDEPAVKN
jgi:hypothetical protein